MNENDEHQVKQFDMNDIQTWPQTTAVFNAPRLDFNKHEWIQQGYEVIDNCRSGMCVKVGIPIPFGKMLVKKGGRYELVNEMRG